MHLEEFEKQFDIEEKQISDLIKYEYSVIWKDRNVCVFKMILELPEDILSDLTDLYQIDKKVFIDDFKKTAKDTIFKCFIGSTNFGFVNFEDLNSTSRVNPSKFLYEKPQELTSDQMKQTFINVAAKFLSENNIEYNQKALVSFAAYLEREVLPLPTMANYTNWSKEVNLVVKNIANIK